MTAAKALCIHHLGVAAMNAPQQDFEGIFAARHQNEVDVIRHETPSQHPGFGVSQVLVEQPEVGGSVQGREETRC